MKTTRRPKKYDELTVSAVISEGLSIEGDLIGSGSIRVDGTVVGQIKVEEGLLIGEAGCVTGSVFTESVIVFGRIEGDVVCKTLKINPSGIINGNVTAEYIGIDLGGKVNGKVEIIERQQEPLLLEQKAG